VGHIVRLIDRLTGIVGNLGAWIVVPLFSVMLYEVGARFLFDLPTFWAYELAYMMTGAHFVLGIALVLRSGQHIRVDFLHAALPPRARAAIDLVVYLAFLLPVVWWMTWRLGVVAVEAFVGGEVSGESGWNPVIWPLRAVVALGFALFGLQILAEIAKTARIVFTRHKA
jgi:TRAP-type mannitol/chloroaromatic compound transport system permease small subunit